MPHPLYERTFTPGVRAIRTRMGWPYVQHRSGPKGFLKVLDSHTLACADFCGNRQYISVGNLSDTELPATHFAALLCRRA